MWRRTFNSELATLQKKFSEFLESELELIRIFSRSRSWNRKKKSRLRSSLLLGGLKLFIDLQTHQASLFLVFSSLLIESEYNGDKFLSRTG
jgi:hypothetical protein